MLDLQSKLKAIGRDPDLNKVFDVFIASGKPRLRNEGYEGKRKLQEQARAEVCCANMPQSCSRPDQVLPVALLRVLCLSASSTLAPSGDAAPPAALLRQQALSIRWHQGLEPATEVNALRAAVGCTQLG